MTLAVEPTGATRTAAVKPDRDGWAWAMFEWGRNPHIILCTIYVFAPFAAVHFVGDGVKGQAFVANASALGGLLVALTAPILGMTADAMGRRKPLLMAVVAALVAIWISYWWAIPGGGGLTPAALFALFVATGVFYAWGDTLYNALLPAAGKEAVAETSGLGLALGNLAALILLAVVLWGFAMPGVVDLPGVPAAPLFGLSRESFEPERMTGPLSGVWFLIFAIPLFLTLKEPAQTGVSLGAALGSAVTGIGGMFRRLFADRNLGIFIVARMLYADAKAALIIFSGIYAAGIMGWGFAELAAQGLFLSIFAALGGIIGGRLDRAFGPRRAVIIELIMCLVALFLMLQVSKETIVFGIHTGSGPVWDFPVFRSAPELCYLAIGIITAIFVTAAYGSSRTLLVSLAPPARLGEAFGLYALAGNATAWLAPALIGALTLAFNSQRIGMSAISILFVAGLGLLLTLMGGDTATPARD